MMGSIFAGCDESPGTFELFQEENTKCTEVWVPLLLWKTEAKTATSSLMRKSLCRRAWKAVWHIRNSGRYSVPAYGRSAFRYGILRNSDY